MTTFGEAFLDDYFAECDEHLAAVRQALLALEASIGRARPDARIIEELFRAYHSLKGLAGMVEDRDAEVIAHEMEGYLRSLRDGDAILSSVGVDALIDGTHALEQAVSARHRGAESGDYTATLERLRSLMTVGVRVDVAPAASDGVLPVTAAPAWQCIFSPSPELSARGVNVNSVRARLRERGEIRSAMPRVGADGTVAFRFVFDGPLDASIVEAWRGDGMSCGPAEEQPSSDQSTALESTTEAGLVTRSSAHYVRVDLSRLDDLMRMIGDMVIRRARLADALARAETHVPPAAWRDVQENAAGMERQLRDLRDGVMRVRLVPVGEIFRRMPFVVRDLARESDRRALVVLSGQDTQIDKFLVERMMDPVLHLVRNAVSHGLEPAAERIAAGKPPDGTITLSARASGEFVNLEIADDGRGVVPERVVARARRLGLPVPPSGEIDDAALLELLCSPGFSTRDAADKISGRGFGMAVVRKTVHELGGAMRLASTVGAGTRFSIDLPLTLAITDALITAVGTETFAVPQNAVREVIEVETASIRQLEGAEVVPFRGRALPVLRLRSRFGVEQDERRRHHALIVGNDTGAVGLLVDRVISQREIVVRTTADPLIKVDGIAGATDLGDGRAVLILDVVAIARATRGRAGASRPRHRESA